MFVDRLVTWSIFYDFIHVFGCVQNYKTNSAGYAPAPVARHVSALKKDGSHPEL
jgi:hypothetical protein